jgi:hypothetical protein
VYIVHRISRRVSPVLSLAQYCAYRSAVLVLHADDRVVPGLAQVEMEYPHHPRKQSISSTRHLFLLVVLVHLDVLLY